MSVLQPSIQGGYARERYEQDVRGWRDAIRYSATLVFGPLVFGPVLLSVVDGRLSSWIAVTIFGVGTSLWFLIGTLSPGYLEEWRTAAEGHSETARALTELSSEWTVLHSLNDGHGKHVHVLVGPAGVFLLDSKSASEAAVLDCELWLWHRYGVHVERTERPPRRHTLAGAAWLHCHLGLADPYTCVHAVSVLWCRFADGVHEDEDKRYTIIHGEQLVAWLEGRPRALSSERIGEISNVAMRLASWRDSWNPAGMSDLD
jgi:hypothetical protein